MASTAIVYSIIARDAASHTFRQVGRAAAGTDSTLAKLGRTAKVAGEALAVGLAVGLAESTKQAVEFQSSMAKIQTQAGATAKDVKTLSKQVLDLGAKTQQGPQQLSEALYHLKSVGMDNVSAMKALKEASDLAAVGGSSLEETTNALAGAWRTGIKGAGSFHEAVSTVNAIIGAGNMRMEQFTEAIGTGILPSAKTFGLSLKQVGAALALMTDEGVPAVDAATRLRMSFSLLGAPSGAAEKQLKKVGLSGIQLANAMRGKDGLIGAVQLLKDHLDKSGMSAAQQSQLLSRAFGGGRSSSAILTMVNNLDVLKKKQDQVNRTTGKFDDAVKTQRKTAEAQWKLLTSNLEVMSIRVGTKVLPPLTKFVQYLSQTAMPAASGFGRSMAKLIPYDDIKKRFGETKKLFTDFYDGLSGKAVKNVGIPRVDKAPVMSMPKSASAAFGQQIHDAIATGFKDVDWGSLGSSLGKGLGSAFQWLVSHGTELADKLGAAIGRIDWVNVGKKLGVVALPFAIGFIDNLFEPMFHVDFWKKHWLDTIIAVISVVPIGKLGGVLSKLGSKVPWSRFGEALTKIPWQKLIPFSEKLGQAVGPIILRITEFVATLGFKMIEAFARRFPKIAQWFSEQLILLPVRLGDVGRLFYRKGTELIARLGKGLLDRIPGSSRSFIRAALKWFGRFTLYQIGLNAAKSLLSGAWSVMKGVGGWLKSHISDPIINGVKSLFGIKSPSTVFRGIGGNLIAGLKGGILGSIAGVGKWLGSHVVSPITSRFSHAKSWLSGAGHDIVSGLKNGITDKIKAIGSWIKSSFVDPIVGYVKKHFKINSPSKVFIGIGKSITKGLVMGMASKHPGAMVKTVFGGLPQALAAFIKKGLISAKDLPGAALKALGGLGGDLLGLLGLGGSGSGSSANQKIGATLAAIHGWAGPQWAALKNLWNGESGWNERALNKSSGAYGIPQSLPASKMSSAGSDWKTNPATQIKWGLNYIASRYGNPVNAYSAWLSRSPHWYAKGTNGGAARGLAWVGEKGPELVNFKGGEDVLSHPDSMAFAKTHGIKLPGYASGTILNAADRVHRDKQRVEDAKDALANAKRRHKGVAAAEKRLEAARKELKAAEIALSNARRSAKTSISNTIKTGLLKTLSTGTSSAIASAIKSLATKLLNAGYTKTAASIQKKGNKLESLADKRASVQKRIAAANQYAADQAGNIRDFLSISGTSASNVGGLISQMGSQQKTASGFVKLTKSLKGRGASKELLAQLAAAGPGSQLATILGAKGVTTSDIAKLNKLTKSGGKLATSFGKDMADMMYDSGKNAGKGFLAGLKAQEKALGKQMAKLAKDLIAQIKKALKIKSPSQVFRDEVGKNVVLGMAHGIDLHSHLVGAATQRLADTATGVSMRRRYVPTAGRGRAAAPDEQTWARFAAAIERSGSEVHVHFNDDRLRDLIDVQVKPKIKASEDRQAHRARVGRR